MLYIRGLAPQLLVVRQCSQVVARAVHYFSHVFAIFNLFSLPMIQLKTGISASQLNKGRKRRGSTRARRSANPRSAGLVFKRVFSDAKRAPFDEMDWKRRTAEITDDSGKIIFKQDNIEV